MGIPYRKRWYRLHHITGLLFGLFLIAWGISGMISMQRIPQWLINTNGNYIFNSSRMWGKKPLPIDTYELDYRQLKTAYPDLKEVSWTHFRNIPVYTVIVGNRELQIDASTPKIKKIVYPRTDYYRRNTGSTWEKCQFSDFIARHIRQLLSFSNREFTSPRL